MTTRLAILGYGAVAGIHAAKLITEPGVRIVSVSGPNREKAASFASQHGIPRVCDSIDEALSGADAAIICSPSAAHFEQARECLDRGAHTLVELPPCENAGQAVLLTALARRHGVTLRCAHTSRFVRPYAQIRKWIETGLTGDVQEVHYIRCHKLRERTWSDNALLHHAAHPLDLLFYWCGGVEPVGCVVRPDAESPQAVSILGRLPSGGAVTITVTYCSHLHQTRLLIAGKKHSIEIEGLSELRSDLEGLEFKADEQEVYEEAIHLQDVAFLRACQGNGDFVSWNETIAVLRTIDRCRALAG